MHDLQAKHVNTDLKQEWAPMVILGKTISSENSWTDTRAQKQANPRVCVLLEVYTYVCMYVCITKTKKSKTQNLIGFI